MFFTRYCSLLICASVAFLVGFGMVMLSSASTFRSGAEAQFLHNQLIYLGIGVVVGLVMASVDYRVWGRVMWVILAGAAIALVLCYVPHIGKRVNGASRWIAITESVRVQPSEFAKIAILLFLGWWYGKNQKKVKEWWAGFAVPTAVTGVLLGLILFEKDVGTTLLLGCVLCMVWLAAGIRFRYLALAVLIGAAGVAGIVAKDPERMRRIVVAMGDGVGHEKGEGYQQRQSLIALGSGGLTGLGLGESRQKRYYVPEAHTDFIFSIVGEELGLRWTLAVVLAYVVFVLSGGFVAVKATDPGGALLAFGIVALIGLQAFINIGVVTKFLPNKGLALPFISYGGSNIVACLAMVGLLLSVARHASPGFAPVRNVPFPEGGGR